MDEKKFLAENSRAVQLLRKLSSFVLNADLDDIDEIYTALLSHFRCQEILLQEKGARSCTLELIVKDLIEAIKN